MQDKVDTYKSPIEKSASRHGMTLCKPQVINRAISGGCQHEQSQLTMVYGRNGYVKQIKCACGKTYRY